MFKEGVETAYSNVKVKGNSGDFKKGVNFTTKLIVHDKKSKEKYNSKQQFVNEKSPILYKDKCKWY